jgi:hypothetical protein
MEKPSQLHDFAQVYHKEAIEAAERRHKTEAATRKNCKIITYTHQTAITTQACHAV